MDPQRQYQRSSQIWQEQIVEGYLRHCDEGLEASPWPQALINRSAHHCTLAIHNGLVADLLTSVADRVRTQQSVPVRSSTIEATSPLRGTTIELFLEALRVAEHQSELRGYDTTSKLRGLFSALLAFLAVRQDIDECRASLEKLLYAIDHKEIVIPHDELK